MGEEKVPTQKRVVVVVESRTAPREILGVLQKIGGEGVQSHKRGRGVILKKSNTSR